MSPIQKSLEASQKSTRLTDDVRPYHYSIEIAPDITNAKFSGKETISLDITKTVSKITLHAAEITIHTAILRGDNFEQSCYVEHDEDKQQVSISSPTEIPAGKLALELVFDGILNNKLRGFYRSSFKDSIGTEKFVATTKFEPSDARRAFPCFDEPKFKAVFEISLLIDEQLCAISNSSLIEEKPMGTGKKLVKFAPTIKMSSYLVAYVVGEFESSEPVKAKSGAEIRIWSVPGKQHLSAFALKWAKASLDYFAEYFNIDYPSNKLDLIAIPDFASGAMENFGAITFRETALLLDENRATHAEKKRVAEVISHENAHMWFGDFVTMDWWNGLWLNEAFATFMAAKAVDTFAPDWKFWEDFNIEKAGAMRIDGLHSSRSIEFPVATPEDARAMFDVLTYEKGCAILRMLELYVGEEVFRRGCRIYMNRHAYANTETSDLWKALDESVAENGLQISVAEMMDSWVYQKGFPLISIESNEADQITVHQTAFRYLNKANSEKQLWQVPLSIRSATTGSTTSKYLTLSFEAETFSLGFDLGGLVANSEGRGFFRITYSDALRKALLNNTRNLSGSERFNLISDLWAATQSGAMSVEDYLSSLKQLIPGERDSNVFTVVLGSFSYLRRICKAACPEKLPGLCHLVQTLLNPVLDELGWEEAKSESAQISDLRAALISSLGSFGDKQVQTKVGDLWTSYLKNSGTLSANLLPPVVEVIASQGDDSRYEQFLELRKTAKTPQEESRFLFALTAFRDEALISRTLQSILDGAIKTQDVPQVLRSLFFNIDGTKLSWQFLTRNWDKLVAMLPLQGIIRLCEGITCLIDPSLENEISSFFVNRNIKGNEKGLAQNLETLQIANAFLEREKTNLQRILA